MKTLHFTCEACGKPYTMELPLKMAEVLSDILVKYQVCKDCHKLKVESIKDQDHPEIPSGQYCYGDGIVCQHWEGFDGGAKCHLLNMNSIDYDPFNLIWDQCKMCGINDEWES